MQDPELEDIDLPHILWYFQELERLGWKPNGINIVAIAIRKFFEFCNLRGYRTFNEQLIPVPRKEFNIPRVTDIETFKKILKQIPDNSPRPHHIRNRAFLLLLWDTGARVGELCSIDSADLDLKKRTALIHTEKSRGRRPIRQIFWTEETNKHLKLWIEKKEHLQKLFKFHDPEALFVSISKCGQYDVRGSRMGNRGAAEIMRMLSNKAKIPVVNAHSIRHSMGRDTVRTLRSNSAVSNVLGHSNLDSSYIYTMLWGEDLKEDWSQVMKKRGNPLAAAPKSAKGFPRMKGRQESATQGRLRPVVIKTGKYGRMVRQ
ncbi:tyrosine-type recombinase/integrase [Candidatus Uhrbacteria bacterium]|nr:tyrosine-type recombinase/integrase [Candidatus Uhrbacteria bacterium]